MSRVVNDADAQPIMDYELWIMNLKKVDYELKRV